MTRCSVSKNYVIPRRAKPDVGISSKLEHLSSKTYDFSLVYRRLPRRLRLHAMTALFSVFFDSLGRGHDPALQWTL